MAILLLVLTAAAPGVPRRPSDKAHDESFDYTDGTVLVHVPAGAPHIGVLVLHSLGHTASEPVAQGWTATSDRHGFVAIYPQRGISWNAGLCCGEAASSGRDDVTWLAGVVQAARARYHLNTIYLAGFSNGGMMVERLVAEDPGISDRFAVWGAAPEMPSPGSWSGVGNLFEGSDDGFVPRSGGSVTFEDVTTSIRSSAATLDWIRGIHLNTTVVDGWGHPPPPNWPEMAWGALAASG